MKSLWRKLFPRRSRIHPDAVKVAPPSYRPQVRDAFWHAVARLEGIGVMGRRHNIERVDIRPGTVKRPAGWALPLESSPTGYAGGWRACKRLVIVSDPHTGAASSGVMAHEWAHALMDLNGGPYGADGQHAAMRRAGLM